jgi:predicted ATPase
MTNRGAQSESRLKKWIGKGSKWGAYRGREHYVAEAVKGWVVYHVHDTSKTAPMRRKHPISNYRELQPDAGNIAPFLRIDRRRSENR